ncbi:TPA: class I SAM-dependent methyltransferase, partial [Campylobacter jejuni]
DAKYIFDNYNHKFIYRNCPICNNDNSNSFELFLDRYHICKCNICASRYVNPVPSEEVLSVYYNKCESVAMYTEQTKKINYDELYKDRNELIMKVLALNSSETINILEVGCNSGNFAIYMRNVLSKANMKFNIYGIDVDSYSIQMASEKTKNMDNIHFYNISANDINKLNIKFDLIVAFDLIEHIVYTDEFMKNIFNALNHRGFVVLTCPNASGITEICLPYSNEKKIISSAIYPPMHLNAFDTTNILLFAYIHHFSLYYVDTNGKFDISILELCKNEINCEMIKCINKLDIQMKNFLQYYTKILLGSGYMRVILRKI